MAFGDRLRSGLSKSRQRFAQLLHRDRKADAAFFEELEEALLGADVGLETTEALIDTLKEERKAFVNVRDAAAALRTEVIALLGETPPLAQAAEGPSVYLFLGVNGVGKTTTLGKMAVQLSAQKKKVLLAAGDTFRAAALEQLQAWADRARCDLVHHTYGSDPAAVVYDALVAARSRKADVVLIDTAGRLQTKQNLMAELGKVVRIIQREMPGAPHESFLVLDATTGQNALSQARGFTEVVPLTGIILTKLDGTAKGGVVLALRSELGLPVRYIGVGEGPDDLLPFDAAAFADALFSVDDDQTPPV